jgi:hypothetical protein
MDTKTLHFLKITIPARISRVLMENWVQTISEVKSYKTLELTNEAFEKKNNHLSQK